MKEVKRGEGKRSALYAPMALVLILVAAIVLISLIFRVDIIQVENDTVYSDEQIIQASGLETGVNLFLVNNFTAVSSIYATMPYVENVSLKRVLPNRIIISVTGSEAVACVPFGGDYYLINDECRLLGKIDADETASFIVIRNLEPVQPVAGEYMTVSDTDTGKDELIMEFFSYYEKMGIINKVSWLDVTDSSNPAMGYDNRFDIYLGGTDQLGRRLALAKSAIDQLASGDEGKLELETDSISNKVYFSPD